MTHSDFGPVMRNRAELLLALTVVIATACGGGGNSQGSTAPAAFTLRIADATPQPTDTAVQLQYWTNQLTSLSGGKATVEPHYGDLGGDVEILHQLQTGALDGILTSTDILGTIEPKAAIAALPFLFANRTEVYKVLDGKTGQAIFADLPAKQGIVGLAFTDFGFENFVTTSKVIDTPGDMKGLKMRSKQAPLTIAAWRALGANAVALPPTEFYTSLQTHTVDGLDLPVAYYLTSKLYEVAKVCNVSNWALTGGVLLLSKAKWDTLSKAQQDVVVKAAIAAAKQGRDGETKAESGGLAQLKGFGVNVHQISDLAPFKAAVQPVYSQLASQIGTSLIDQAKKEAAS